MKKQVKGICFAVLLFFVLDRIIGFSLNIGLERYFGLGEPSKVLLLGHSHLMLATDKEKLEDMLDCSVSKYCREGVNAIDRKEMLKLYYQYDNADSLKVVMYGVDQFMFTSARLSQNSYTLFYPFIDDKVMNEYIYQMGSISDYLLHKCICTTRYSDALINSSLRGWLHNWSNYKFGHLDVERLISENEQGTQRTISFEPELIKAFEETLDFLSKKGIKVVLVNTPVAAPLNGYEPESYNKIISYLQNLAKNNELIEYLDFNPEYSENFDLFFDPIHLNPTGQKVISQKIGEYLQKLFANK